MRAELVWKSDMVFECDNSGLKTMMDINSSEAKKGPNPKELVMNAMMGCTAMDVVSILKKMRQEIKEFRMENEVEKTLEHPIHFKTSLLTFHMGGDIDPDKAIKAVDSSLTKYCGVNYMISFSCEISFRIFLNGLEIKTGKVLWNS